MRRFGMLGAVFSKLQKLPPSLHLKLKKKIIVEEFQIQLNEKVLSE